MQHQCSIWNRHWSSIFFNFFICSPHGSLRKNICGQLPFSSFPCLLTFYYLYAFSPLFLSLAIYLLNPIYYYYCYYLLKANIYYLNISPFTVLCLQYKLPDLLRNSLTRFYNGITRTTTLTTSRYICKKYIKSIALGPWS